MASEIPVGDSPGGERPLVSFVKFVLVGFANTAFGYALFALFYLWLGSHQLAITLATVCGAVSAVWLLNILLLEGLTALAISPLAGQTLALPLLVLLSYAINRYLVFGRHR